MSGLEAPGGTLLVANRGEIAVRIIQTAQEMGLRCVAVFTEADRDALFVQRADEAVYLGSSDGEEPYLSVEKLLEAAAKSGAHAIHPGYGFLSENARFASACAEQDLKFIGPAADVISTMGNKNRAKEQMASVGVNVVPGVSTEGLSDEQMTFAAEKIGFPVLVKAVAGGGGRGMRVVLRKEKLQEALESARREAKNAFGDGALLLEKYIEDARHIEVQIFADEHGNVVHFFERDCSIQRRRQKVVEEAPAQSLSQMLREELYQQSVEAAKRVGYVGAGTLEFIVDSNDDFYFIEMNTRLQVEHPVTECIADVDFVRWQLMVAMGKELPLQQGQIERKGHAIEVRLYTEDPEHGFLPGGGSISRFDTSALKDLPGVKVHAGVRSGDEMSALYDPMVAKVVAHADSREEATRRLHRALSQLVFFGPAHNQSFLLGLLGTPQWQNASFRTSTLDAWLDEGHALFASKTPPLVFWQTAALLMSEGAGHAFSSTGQLEYSISLCSCGLEKTMTCTKVGDGWRVVEKESLLQKGHSLATTKELCGLGADEGRKPKKERLVLLRESSCSVVVDVDGRRLRFARLRNQRHLVLGREGDHYAFAEASPYPVVERGVAQGEIHSPVAGRIAMLSAAVGQEVAVGDVLVVVEAMKMENRLHAEIAGTVSYVAHVVGDQVQAGELIYRIV